MTVFVRIIPVEGQTRRFPPPLMHLSDVHRRLPRQLQTRLRKIVGCLHPHQGISADLELPFKTQRHLCTQTGMAIQHRAQRLPRHPMSADRSVMLRPLGSTISLINQRPAWTEIDGCILRTMIILQIHVSQGARLGNGKSKSPIACYGHGPSSIPVARQAVQTIIRRSGQFIRRFTRRDHSTLLHSWL